MYLLPTLWSQSGDILESFPETLNISWLPEKPENSHAIVGSLWIADMTMQDLMTPLCDNKAISVINASKAADADRHGFSIFVMANLDPLSIENDTMPCN
jgi:hypothetical protein